MATIGDGANAPSKEGDSTFVDIGWRKADDVLRRVSQQKVNDCKEGLDAFLVFAGLYSAVLTAFLVESYKTLQQDPTITATSLLRQLAHQTSSYSVNREFINSTRLAPVYDSAPTSAPQNAILVNGLWFASLVFSLAGASICITVQQWLRDFLAMEDEDALLRLRIRHFREPGLATWRVYRIAAILPLLLQVSFALFFIGLCYFTADVNQTIGRITLSLVLAWAFLFLCFLLLPAADPRCPYKVPFLKSALALLPFRPLAYMSGARYTYRSIWQAEDEVKHSEANDLEIVLRMDSMECDDALLTDTMWKALQPSTRQSTELISFIRSAIRNRVHGTQLTLLTSSPTLPSGILSPAAYNAFISMVANVIQTELLRQSSVHNAKDSPPKSVTPIPEVGLKQWFHDCFYILFTSFDVHVSTELNHAIQLCLSRDIWRDILLDFLFEEAHWDQQSTFFSICLARMKGGLAMTNTTNLCKIMARLFPRSDDDPARAIDTAGPRLPEQFVDSQFLVPEDHQKFEYDLFIQRVRTVDLDNSWEQLDVILLERVVDRSLSTVVQISSTDPADVVLMRYLLLESPHSQGTVNIAELAWRDTSAIASRVKERYIERIFLDSIGSESFTRLLVHMIQTFDPKYRAKPSDRTYTFSGSLHRKAPTLYGLEICHFYLQLIDRDIAMVGRKTRLWKDLFSIILFHLDDVAPYGDVCSRSKTAETCLSTITSIARATGQENFFTPELIAGLQRIRQPEGPVPHSDCQTRNLRGSAPSIPSATKPIETSANSSRARSAPSVSMTTEQNLRLQALDEQPFYLCF